MEEKTNSFAYTREVLKKLMLQAREEVTRMGGNKGVEKILDALEIGEEKGRSGGMDKGDKEVEIVPSE